MSALRALRQNWATPASLLLHGAVAAGFLVQFSRPAPSLPADNAPTLAVEVMVMPTPIPDMVNAAPPAPPPPEPEIVEDEPPPVIESVAEAAPPEPPPPLPEVKKKPEEPKPAPPMKRPPRPVVERPPVVVPEPSPVAAPPAPPIPAPPANQLALAAPAGRMGPPPDYLTLISATLERNKIYPRAARERRQQGRARLRFVIDRKGNVLRHELLHSSGYRLLDGEVEALIRRVSPLPPLPADIRDDNLELTVAIDFNLR